MAGLDAVEAVDSPDGVASLGARLSSSAWFAFAASASSVGLGVLREFLIWKQLGFSAVNDRLQVYLYVVYVISMMNDAVRLATLNAIQRMPAGAVGRLVLGIGAIYALGAGAFLFSQYATSPSPPNPWLFVGAIASAWLNMGVVLLVATRQRSGIFLRAHLINVMPNAILIPGIVLVWLLHPADAVTPLAILYFTLPLFQIFLLLRIPVNEGPHAPYGGAEIRQNSGLFVAHGLAGTGALAFQGALSQSVLQSGAGEFSKLALALRIYDSMRFVLVDTYVARKLAVWKNETTFTHIARILQRLLAPQVVLVIAAFALARLSGSLGTALVILTFGLTGYIARTIYYFMNTSTVLKTLVWQFGIQELAFATCVFFGARYGWLGISAMVAVWYTLRPFAQILLLNVRLRPLQGEAA